LLSDFSNQLKNSYASIVEINNRVAGKKTQGEDKPEVKPTKKVDANGNLIMVGKKYIYRSGEGKDDFEVEILNLNMEDAPDKIQVLNLDINSKFLAIPNKLELSKVHATV
jgi:hypothetical protein